MTDNNRAWGFQRVEETYHIAKNVEQGVLINRAGTVALAVAPHVGSNSVKTRRSKRVELVTPRP